MSTQHVTAYYLDAHDGRPASEAPLRHGPAKPLESLQIDAVDRRQRPPLIIGRLPTGEALAPGMAIISEQEHADLLAGYQAWRDEVAERAARQQRAARAGRITTDKRAIAADNLDTATVEAGTNDTAYFVIDDDVHAVEPDDGVATLFVRADAPGPIRIEWDDNRVTIIAEEPA